MKLQDKLKRVRDVLNGTSARGRIGHYRKPTAQRPSYIVWQEDGEDQPFQADNRKAEVQITGTIDCYTQVEYDPLIDEVNEALSAGEISWTIQSVQYEDETKLIHYEWRFTL